MKFSRKGIFIGFGAIIAAAFALYYVLRPAIFMGTFFFFLSSQMHKGQKFMDSMDADDFYRWESMTKEFLKEYDSKKDPMYRYGTGGSAMPKDLSDFGVLRIDIYRDSVCYVWAGGMDHTYLDVVRNSDGTFFFRGRYDERSEKLLHGEDKTKESEQGAAANP
jgi:hypothetical protein